MHPPFGEAAVLKLKPSWLIVVPRLIFPAIIAAVVLLTFRYFQSPRGGVWAITWFQWLAIAAGLLGMGLVVIWLPMQYLLTDARAMSRTGWLVRITRDIPLENVQHIVMQQSPWETITGTGTILFATAGTDGYALAWQSISNPQSVLDRVRAAHDQARNASRVVHTAPAPAPVPSFKVIGLVGGIGSGKSAVAAALARRNYVVIDADKDAKAALERPDVRDTLVQWWGPDILTDGRIDRKKVAQIVFADADQRTRLESLIHPIVRADRHATIARARRESRPGVVIDAPLLFEAGSDKDCDLIWFIDTPLEQRTQRILSRGWTPEELTRREAAQLSLQSKKSRSHAVIPNNADLAALDREVQSALTRPRLVRGDAAIDQSIDFPDRQVRVVSPSHPHYSFGESNLICTDRAGNLLWRFADKPEMLPDGRSLGVFLQLWKGEGEDVWARYEAWDFNVRIRVSDGSVIERVETR